MRSAPSPVLGRSAAVIDVRAQHCHPSGAVAVVDAHHARVDATRARVAANVDGVVWQLWDGQPEDVRQGLSHEEFVRAQGSGSVLTDSHLN